MPRKNQYTCILIITLLILSIYVSTTQLSTLSIKENQITNQQSINTDVSDFIAKLEKGITEHKITSSELEKLKNIIGVSTDRENYSIKVGDYGTGLHPPSAEEWASLTENIYIVDEVNYVGSVASVDNSALPWFPPIGNQGSQGSCTTWAVGYYLKTFQEAKEHAWNLSGAAWIGGYYGHPTPSYQSMIMSPAFIYNLINNGQDQGSNFEEAIQLVCFIGESSWANMPYNSSDYTSWPSEVAWTEAPYFRGNSSGVQYMYVSTDSGINNLKNYLAQENLAVIGVGASQYSNLTSSDLWTLDNYVNPSVDHANTIVGYDDNFAYNESGQTKYGAFKIANSWGIGGGWEKVNDGFYWISYEAMKQRVGSCMFYFDKTDYHPDLLAKFMINHTKRSECSITVGLGTKSSPIATKSFSTYVSGGNQPFCSNIIVMDITEFENNISINNQPFYLKVYDGGSTTTGTITYFSINNFTSSGTPLQTSQGNDVYLMLTYLVPTVTVSPSSGPAEGVITLNGTGFSANNSVKLSYLNPLNSSWTILTNSLPTMSLGEFIYSFNAPDLLQNNLAGDNSPQFNTIIFKATDNSTGYSCNSTVPYTEWKRGLTQIGNAIAGGLYGNNTDLASTVFIQAGQPFIIVGRWFNPGNASVLFDGAVILQDLIVDETGYFINSMTLPSIINAGVHNITITDLNTRFTCKVALLPTVTNDYDGLWHSYDLTIHLASNDNSSTVIYYRINGWQTKTIAANGQPVISSNGENNTIEYWGIWANGNVTVELTHTILAGIKIDKALPQATIQIGNGSETTSSRTVTLNLNATALSGITQVRFSNTGDWTNSQWESYTTNKTWLLTDGDGLKTVYFQVRNNANMTATYVASITLSTSTTDQSNSGSQSGFDFSSLLSPQNLAIIISSALVLAIVIAAIVILKKRR